MKPPAFWTQKPKSPLGAIAKAALTPLSGLYAWAGARRIAATEPETVDPAVICIGNLTLGGTGKTPIAIAALDWLNDNGISAHAVTRGYGGSLRGPVRIRLAKHTLRETGDEPRLLARTASTWISPDRVFGARQAAASGAKAVVLDDGFQNPSLAKDLSILVIDGEAGWGNGLVFPAGPLREPVSRGLARADAIIVMTGSGDVQPDLESLGLSDLEIPVLTAWLKPTGALPEGPLLAFAGIGRPQKFFDSLVQAGAQLVDTRSFADHHPYSKSEITELLELASAHGASLITTEKDWVRIDADQQGDVAVWPVRARFSEPVRFTDLLQDAMDAASQRR
tara:strand:- start:25 stop:1035 length:1011 start_codon:yes stop_codon:yes gene_type:complete